MTAIELIAKEREEQILKHGRTIKHDIEINHRGQLVTAATALLNYDREDWPLSWDTKTYDHIIKKSAEEILTICAALLAAEIDRLQYIKNTK
jgi:hypothetical protein